MIRTGGGLRCLFLLGIYLGFSVGERGPLGLFEAPLVEVVDTFLDFLTTNVSGDCSKDVQALLDSAKDGQEWALSVLDATGRPGSGLLTGGLTFPGSYSQCLRDRANYNSNFSTQQQHCLVNLKFGDTDNAQEVPWGLRRALANSTVRLGICFPSSCRLDEALDALNTAVSTIFNGSQCAPDMGVCSSETDRPGTAALSVVICIFSLLLVLALLGTTYDIVCTYRNQVIKEPKADVTSPSPTLCNASTEQLCDEDSRAKKSLVLRQILLSFSALRNGAKILKVEKGSGSIDSFHGMRFISMTWIITGHSFSFAFAWLAFRNPKSMVSTPSDLLSQTFANGTLSVDTFFYLSGFLLVYVTMKHLKKHPEKFNAPLVVLHRYIRLTPLMMLIIAFCAVILPWTGRGPFWGTAIEMYGPWCAKNWWINLLYLQNFVNTSNMCLSHSWYSAVDMQFFLVAVVVLLLLKRKAIFGLGAMVFLFLVTAGVTVYLTVAHHLPGTSYIGILPQTVMDEFSSEVYIKPYCRMGPYLVGMAAGYWLQTSTVVLRKRYVVMGWILAAILNLVVLYSTWPAYAGHLPNAAGAAAYSALSRSGWAIGLAWVTYACITGNGGFVNTMLSWKVLIPLSRLTYCAYLIHPIVMAAFYGSRETTFDFNIYFLIYMILGNLTITYSASFILSTLLEAPFIALEKIIFGS